VFGHFRLSRGGGGLFRLSDDGNPVAVTIGSRALEVLAVLVEHHGDLVSKDEIMAAVWPDTVVEEANLTVQISALRRVLDNAAAGPSHIQTVAGRGYRFVAPVRQILQDSPPTEPPGPMEAAPKVAAKQTPIRKRPDIALTLAAVALILTGWTAIRTGFTHRSQPDSARPLLSIVVLPFANLSDDPEQAYFADAITDDLTTDLSRIAGSVVIAHSTALSYRNKPIDVRQIGHDLDVRYILGGSVRRSGDQIMVNAELVDAESAAQVWADRFSTDRGDLGPAQSEITGRLARTLNLELIAAADHRIERERVANPDAWDLAMRGWALWFRPFSPTSRQEATRSFEQALALDPSFGEAKVGMATILASNVGVGLSREPQRDAARAERLLLEAIEQDTNRSRPHEVLGTLRRIENRLEESRVEFATAVALDRNNAHALLGLGQTLMFLGRPADALSWVQQSIRLDPDDPNAAFSDWTLGACHLLLGHIDVATDLLRKARAENPRVYFFQLYLASALGLTGDLQEAHLALAEAFRLKPEVSSFTRWAALQPWIGNAGFVALRANTLDLGLRRAGMPDQ
jgi:adenylate cyclase